MYQFPQFFRHQLAQARSFSSKHSANPYDILRVSQDCTLQDLKDAYRKMAQLYHPDGKQGDAQKFYEIKQSYDQILAKGFPKNQYKSMDHKVYEEQRAKDIVMDRIRRKIEEEAEFRRKFEQHKQKQEELKRKQQEQERDLLRKKDQSRRAQEQKSQTQQTYYESKEYEQMNAQIFNNVKQSKNCYSYDHDKARKVFDKQHATSRQKVIDIEDFEIMRKVQLMQDEKRLEEVQLKKKQQQEDLEKQKFNLRQSTSYDTTFIQEKISGKANEQRQYQQPNYQFGGNSTSKKSDGESTLLGLGVAIVGIAGMIFMFSSNQTQSKNETQRSIPVSQQALKYVAPMTEEQKDRTIQEQRKSNQNLWNHQQKQTQNFQSKQSKVSEKLKAQQQEQKNIDELPKVQIFEFLYNKEKLELQERPVPLPNRDKLNNIIDETYTNKYECLVRQQCDGNIFDMKTNFLKKCGQMNPFIVYEKYINEKKLSPEVFLFMDHYDIPLFEAPDKAKIAINAFFQAKYGMFYCKNNAKRNMYPDYQPFLIMNFEKNPKQLQKTWTIAIMSALADQSIEYDDLKKYERNFEQGRRWQKFIKKQKIEQKKQELLQQRQKEQDQQQALLQADNISQPLSEIVGINTTGTRQQHEAL
ncbi:UNKNOWN [Stylonychia lemnae]|uniref:J domain-containing protein n=1 Tax=Stylonychia lemnae TaxID=5949 RepID=A0A078AR57_STYLE|nr:UNKNOWN [Stylonychia lemnae]|eukprot:CDW84451.1 UNKNOWN [Stylonychia lemnae]